MVLQREDLIGLSQFGALHCPGLIPLYTIENADLIIPAGRYPVEITHSPRFGIPLPLIHVPGREGIRIHIANWASELEGCVAPGLGRNDEMVFRSGAAMNRLFPWIERALADGPLFIEVIDP